MDARLQRELETMAKGWFILKYASEHGVDIGVILPPDTTRENAYKRTEEYHDIMISELKKNGIRNNVEYKALGLDAAYIRNILNQINCGPAVPHGHDDDGFYIRYAENVRDNEKVPGLCGYLEEEYECILGFAYKHIKNVYNLVRIPVILSKETPANTYTIDDDTLAKMIVGKTSRIGRIPDQIKEIKQLLRMKDQPVCFPIFGSYYHSGAPWETFCFNDGSQPYIKLFFKNVSCDSFEEYLAKMAQCLAHEYFHFIHDYFTPATFNAKHNRWENKAVKESLADFFSVMYSLSTKTPGNLKQDVAKERYDAWEDWFGMWPYSEALWYYYDGDWMDFDPEFDHYLINGSFDKFLEVFQESRYGMNRAYSRLLR